MHPWRSDVSSAFNAVMLVVSPLISSVPCCQLIVVSQACSGKSAASASSADCQSRVNCRWRCRCERCSRNCCCSSKRGFVICKLRASCCSARSKTASMRASALPVRRSISVIPTASSRGATNISNQKRRKAVRRCCRQWQKINWRVHQYAFPSASPSAMAKSPLAAVAAADEQKRPPRDQIRLRHISRRFRDQRITLPPAPSR